MKKDDIRPRPPIVTLMGHVDHGKTSLLDAIRKSNIAGKEYGQITQHIGAYTVETEGRKVTFLDTPGHEAFTAMRARGAQVTDIVVLVVAVNEGIMPQTVEAIQHCNAAKVPIIVALNKIDKGRENVYRVKSQLAQYNLLAEDLGGQTLMVETAATQGIGIKDLLESILLQAEMLELKADYGAPAEGVVIETKLDRGTGPNITLILQNGTLKMRQPFLVGSTYGKVKAIFDDQGRNLSELTPGLAARVVGATELPAVGARFIAMDSEKEAREVVEKSRSRQTTKGTPSITLEEFYKKLQDSQVRELDIILKADAAGTLEAISESLKKLSGEEVKINIFYAAVGSVSESDILLAKASNAIILGFNVVLEPSAKTVAQNERVQVRLYRIIYDLIEDVKKALSGLLKPEIKEAILGKALVKQVFNLSSGQVVAGCSVMEGKVARGSKARLVRGETVIMESEIASLRRFKENVREVPAGYECGIILENFKDLQAGDIITTYKTEEVSRSL